MFRFNLAIEMLVISGSASKNSNNSSRPVSISQSRCLSFQGRKVKRLRQPIHLSFNLAIEMLVISGQHWHRYQFGQCLGFNLAIEMLVISGPVRKALVISHVSGFNLAIEMLVISGIYRVYVSDTLPIKFQSRNRDACHFRLISPPRARLIKLKVSISQSRCLSFQVNNHTVLTGDSHGFNLAIEMLVISGPRCARM